MKETLAIVLAAGKGTRMESDLPKVLVEICGRPMIDFVLDALVEGGVHKVVVVVGYRADLVRQTLAGRPGVEFVDQTEQLGTGHAVQVCRQQLAEHEGAVLIVTGDSPLLQPTSVNSLLELFHKEQPACVLGSCHQEDPGGFGRIVRDPEGNFVTIVEDKDASPEERRISEINMSTYVFDCRQLQLALDQLTNDNQQGEYYITDCPGILKTEGKEVRALDVLKPCEALSINDSRQLQIAEEEMKKMGY